MSDLVTAAGANALMPRDMDQAIRMAKAMSSTKLVPKHLRDDPGACLMIVEQAARWNMSPFAVAQCTSLIGEKLMYEGKIIAQSENTIVVEGNHYFPPGDVHMEYLVPSDTHTTCPWKGLASYYHVKGDTLNKDAAWYYPEPKEAAKEIKGHIAFYKGVVVK